MIRKESKDIDIGVIFERQTKHNLEPQYNIYQRHMDSICEGYYNHCTSTLIQPQLFQSTHKFKPTSTLTPSRQLQYFNTLLPNNPITLQQMKQYVGETTRTLIKRKRNCGVFVDQDTLVYGWDNQIKTVRLKIEHNTGKVGFKVEPISRHKGEGEVMEILNSGRQSQILVRELYKILVIDNNEVKYRYVTDHQITNSITNPFKKNQIILTTYLPESETTRLLKYNVGEQPTLITTFDKYLIATQQMDREALITSTYDTIRTYDQRAKTSNIFYTELKKSQRRILDLVWARTHVQNTPYFIVGNSTFVEIFDIRNNSSSVGQHRHYCDQSPPLNYSMFESNYCTTSIESLLDRSQEKRTKIVVGNSPNQFGTSVFFKFPQDLNESPIISCERYMAGLSQKKRYMGTKHPLLALYNYSNSRSQERSLSVIPYISQDKLLFFHGGSHGSLKVEMYEDYKRVRMENKDMDRSAKYLEQMESERFVQSANLVKMEDGEDCYKINYAMYRCISDSNLRKFKDQLLVKGKEEVDVNNGCVLTPPPLVVTRQELKYQNGVIDDQLLDDLNQQW